MATLTPVQPGQLITADFMNSLIGAIGALQTAVAQLSGNTSTGTISVPSVFGRTFAQAKAIFATPTLQLTIGGVVDVNGVAYAVNGTQGANNLVIGQFPQPGTLVAPGTSVNLVLAATSGSVAQAPVITSTDVASQQVTATLRIFGQNFAPLFSDNVVKFNGVQALVSALSSISTLIVTVPAGIPGAPVKPTDPPLPSVTVTVQTPAGTSAQSTTITVTAPPAAPTPVVQSIQETPGVVGQAMHIVLANFPAQPTINSVLFDTISVAGASTAIAAGAGGTFIVTVTVPAGITGVTQSGSSRAAVPIVVTANGAALASFPENLTHL